MGRKSKTQCIGILTSGGDCPGLNAAIRGIAKVAMNEYGMRVIGILDGFRGLVENRAMELTDEIVSGILTRGGTILGTSRDKPHKMMMGEQCLDMSRAAVENARRLQMECLVCLGGGGTQKIALRLAKLGLNVLTLPKTIDNDVAETEISFGHDTAVTIATEAIDRLHTTATSHHRIIVCETMGHNAGWLTLGAGIAGGADVILIPEIPYDLGLVAQFVLERRRLGKRFSIIAAAEGARSKTEVLAAEKAAQRGKKIAKPAAKKTAVTGNGDPFSDETRAGAPARIRKDRTGLDVYHLVQEPTSSRIARQLQEMTGMEARVTSLGHVQRGGIPTAFDRKLCTQLGVTAAKLIAQGSYNVMVAYREEQCRPVPLEKVAGVRKIVPLAHPLLDAARLVGTCLGDE